MDFANIALSSLMAAVPSDQVAKAEWQNLRLDSMYVHNPSELFGAEPRFNEVHRSITVESIKRAVEAESQTSTLSRSKSIPVPKAKVPKVHTGTLFLGATSLHMKVKYL